MNLATSKRPDWTLINDLQLCAVLLIGVALNGCALDDRRGDATIFNMASDDTANRSQAQSKAPSGYPYTSEELWRRLVEVIKTPPDQLTYRKFGEIFELQFDEHKTRWYGYKEVGRYFSVSKRAIKNIASFPFHWISLSQGEPDRSDNVRKRRMAFELELIDLEADRQQLHNQSLKYCVKPQAAEIEALGYRHDEMAANIPLTDRSGIRHWMPWRELYFDDSGGQVAAHGRVTLKVLANGCLIGISYVNVQESD